MKCPRWPSEIKENSILHQHFNSKCLLPSPDGEQRLHPFICPSGYSANPFKRDQKQWAQKKSYVLLCVSLPYCTHFWNEKWFPCILPPRHCPPPLYLLKLPRLIASGALQSAEFREKADLKSTHCALLARPGQLRWRVLIPLCSSSLTWWMEPWVCGTQGEVVCEFPRPLAPLRQHWYNDRYPLSLLGPACLG